MSIVEEEFYRILRELEVVCQENQIEKLESLWIRSYRIGWEGDIVRCAIRDAVFSLAFRYGISREEITYERLLEARDEYLAPPPPPPPPVAAKESLADRAFLEAMAKRKAREERQTPPRNVVPPLKNVSTISTAKLKAKKEDLIKYMLRAIEDNNLGDVKWLTVRTFKNPDARYLIQAIETERLDIAKHLLKLFSPKGRNEREAVAVASIKVGWYIGCITMDRDKDFNRQRMIKVCAQYNQMACLRYFVRKKTTPPSEAYNIALEKGYKEIAQYLSSLKRA